MGFVWFLRRQLRIPNPLFKLELFKHNRTFALSNVAALIHYAAVHSVAFLLSLYLQYIRGMSPLGRRFDPAGPAADPGLFISFCRAGCPTGWNPVSWLQPGWP